jgi:hypothetical protein
MNGSNSSLVRAISGPVILIAVGVLFLLQQSTQYGFSRTWPVLLILIGVLKLLDRVRSADRNLPPGVSS